MDRRTVLKTLGIGAAVASINGIASKAEAIIHDPYKIKVVLLFGEINMDGRGLVADLTPPRQNVHQDCEYWNGGMKRTKYTFSKWFGPENSFFNHLVYNYHTHNLMVFVKNTHIYTSLDKILPGTEYYSELLANVDNAVGGRKVWYTGAFLMQGETDSASEANANAYGERLQQLIAGLRNDLKTPNFSFYLGCTEAPIRRPYLSTVKQAQMNACVFNKNVYLVDTSGLSYVPKTNAFDTNGQLEFGRRAAKQFIMHEKLKV